MNVTLNAKQMMTSAKCLMSLITGKIKRVSVFASGDQCWLSVDADTIIEIPATAHNTGSFTVECKAIIAALALYKDSTVTLKLDMSTRNLELSGNAGNQMIDCDPGVHRKYITRHSTCTVIGSDQMTAIIKRVAPARAGYDRSSILGGINVKIDEQKIEACATDGSRLVYFSDSSLARSQNFNAIVPGDMFEHAEQLFKKDLVACELSIDGRVIQLSNGRVRLQRLAIAGEYPRYHELFPVEFKHEIGFNGTKPVIEAAKQCCKVNNRTNLIKLSLNGKALASSVNGETKFSCDLPTVSYTDDIELSFNGHYLIDALSSASTVTARGDGPLKPWVFTDQDKRVRHLLMPVQSK